MRIIAVALALALATACGGKPADDTEKAELEDRIDDCQKEKAELEETIAKKDRLAQKRLAEFRKLLNELEPLMNSDVLELKVVDGRASIGLSADILFPSGSAALTADGKRNLAEVARVLAARTDQEFQIEGHTDAEPINSREYADNWELGAARAITVLNHMIASGMPPQRLSAATYGQMKPVAANKPGQMLQNRRIEIVLMPDLSDLPGYDELMREYGPRGKGAKGKAGKGKTENRGGKAGTPGKAPEGHR